MKSHIVSRARIPRVPRPALGRELRARARLQERRLRKRQAGAPPRAGSVPKVCAESGYVLE
jgi:hypothetical protein